ncbi:MAG: prephenate dehydrogenase/arogenate dehydrogenase family protein, partial [Rhodobacterales bacterium]|nr:prephenate dehydrogenase/arogenate dehydrogenase family protein [Rhodobacterales bacterium]
LTAQEQDRVASSRHGEEGSALVIGGAGKMGQWFARFLHSQGYRVTVADPSTVDLPWSRTELATDALNYDRIVVTTPLRQTNAVLLDLAARKPRGSVFDIASLKTPIREGLKALSEAGVSVSSIHPMFGPDTDLLSGSHVIFVDLGHPEATLHAKSLFSSTMATSVDMGLDEHDRAIAYVLGLSHALNIAFFTALANTGEQARALAELSSTTFDAQLGVAGNVARENPQLYYDIQALNDYGDHALQGLVDAAHQIRAAVQHKDATQFTALMEAGRSWFDVR